MLIMSNEDYIDLKNYPDLEDYNYIETEKELDQIHYGVYIKYLNSNFKLKQGGFYIRDLKENNTRYVILHQKKYNKFYRINFNKNYIFYKKTENENKRSVFLSMLEYLNNQEDSDTDL